LSRSLEQWLAHQAQAHPQAIDLGLERLTQALDRLHWRQPAVPVISIGGTNGKGSVTAYCEAMLRAAGYRVGTFTSPHLRDYRERIRIDGRLVTNDELIWAFERIEAACKGAVSLTFFEYNALAAFLIFEAAHLDAWVLEVGLGGRLDAVNVVDPTVAVVVSVGLDHQEFLGATREAIAVEKAGIFRQGRSAVLGSRDLPAALIDCAAAVGAMPKRLGVEFDFIRETSGGGASGDGTPGHGTPGHGTPGHGTSGREISGHGTSGREISGHGTSGREISGHGTSGREISGHGTSGTGVGGDAPAGHRTSGWRFRGSRWDLPNLPPPAAVGAIQFANAATAIAALEELEPQLPVSEAAVAQGLGSVRLVGRFQVIASGAGKPAWILDVAHNPDAARVLADNLRELPAVGRTLAVCGILADKDAAGIAASLRDCFDAWWLVSTDSMRGSSAAMLADRVKGEIAVPSALADDIAAGCAAALRCAGPRDRIVVFGSFHTVGPALDWLESQGLLPPSAAPEYT
jgi:dihydrofolate synthase / folylpolyglutamate synthase